MDSKFKKLVFLFQRPGRLLQERLQGVLNYPEMQMLTKSTQLTQNLLYKEKEHQVRSWACTATRTLASPPSGAVTGKTGSASALDVRPESPPPHPLLA